MLDKKSENVWPVIFLSLLNVYIYQLWWGYFHCSNYQSTKELPKISFFVYYKNYISSYFSTLNILWLQLFTLKRQAVSVIFSNLCTTRKYVSLIQNRSKFLISYAVELQFQTIYYFLNFRFSNLKPHGKKMWYDIYVLSLFFNGLHLCVVSTQDIAMGRTNIRFLRCR